MHTSKFGRITDSYCIISLLCVSTQSVTHPELVNTNDVLTLLLKVFPYTLQTKLHSLQRRLVSFSKVALNSLMDSHHYRIYGQSVPVSMTILIKRSSLPLFGHFNISLCESEMLNLPGLLFVLFCMMDSYSLKLWTRGFKKKIHRIFYYYYYGGLFTKFFWGGSYLFHHPCNIGLMKKSYYNSSSLFFTHHNVFLLVSKQQARMCGSTEHGFLARKILFFPLGS